MKTHTSLPKASILGAALLIPWLLLTIGSCATAERRPSSNDQTPMASPGSAASTEGTPNYTQIFEASRLILRRDLMTETQSIRPAFKHLPETELVEELQKSGPNIEDAIAPDSSVHAQLIQSLKEEAKRPLDSSKHTRLIPPKGTLGYEDLKFHSSHPYRYLPVGAQKRIDVPADNLVHVWRQFLLRAKKQIVLNVFDFDLIPIADTLLAQAKKGIHVRVGIDAGVIKHRSEVKAVYERLLQSGLVKVTAVDSVGLNHQKMAAIDWEDVGAARVLFSSGNLTQSCLDPEGDLKGLSPLPADSIPNANHVITMKSWLLANLIHHELSKTLDPEWRLRGAQYPISGVYQVTGPGITDPANLLSEARPVHSVVVAFTPGGGFRDVNKNLIARLINENEGPIRMIQFAFSADEVGEALLAKAQKSFAIYGDFDFLSVGDTPFSMQSWSEFLKLSGWRLAKDKNSKRKYYYEDTQSPWYKTFSPEQWQNLRSRIYIGPRVYRNHRVQIADGSSRDLSAKIHHKILSVGDFAIVGTSFNFSKNAQKNNEQILIFHEPDLARRVDGMTRWLIEQSGQTVAEEAQRRNKDKTPILEEADSAAP